MGHPSEDRPPGLTGGGSSQDRSHSASRSGANTCHPSTQLEKTSSHGKDNSSDALPIGEEDRSRSSSKRSSDKARPCGKCKRPLTGQFVRALGDTYHLECFTCHDCGKIVASKFFPVPDHPPGQYPLCETDYFRRLDLLCFACGGALRGSYITALERKYHIEHFTCSVCPTVFGAQDSYYEHDGRVFCHYHYSTQFAQKCNGCQTAILKQFVEIFRNGQNQHWHPECYMIHKYWNVRLHARPSKAVDVEGAEKEPEDLTTKEREEGDASEASRKQVRDEEEAVEYKVHWIWQTLSSFEERSATCISNMLVHVSDGAYMDGVAAARKFITYVDLLFSAADELDRQLQHRTPIQHNEKNVRSFEAIVHPGLSCSREAKLLCKKVVAFFQLLAEKQNTGVRSLGVTQELLSLVTGLAHYLKLMIRICLSGALRLERETSSAAGLENFLHDIGTLDERLELESQRDLTAEAEILVRKSADTCVNCNKAVEDKCLRLDQRVFHIQCLTCHKCGRELGNIDTKAYWSDSQDCEFCEAHAPTDSRTNAFIYVTRLQQYTYLLRIAHARLLANLRKSGSLPHTSDDPNLGTYDSQIKTGGADDPLLMRSNTRSKSYAGHTSRPSDDHTYEDTIGDIRRLRSTRMERQLSHAGRHVRTSRIIGGPEGMRPGSADGNANKSGGRRTSTFQIIEDRDANGDSPSQLAFSNQDAMTLDDIPRIVQAQQTREQRPNASKYARQPMIPQDPRPRYINGHSRDPSMPLDERIDRPAGTKKYFSELTALEYFIVRHVAVLSMEPLLEGLFNQEELLDLIETKRPTFWSKFGKAFQAKEKKSKPGKTAIFGVPLEQLLERDYEESTDGVGPGSLKVPSLVQEALSAMKTMDMSVEGVFRKNGNIKRLNDLKEEIDSKGSIEVDLTKENPVQVAALLKKFLRELPDPLLTYKLHRLWITSQKLEDADRRRRVLHLTCCLLPKTHRDVMEVLFAFMTWVASFSHVDEESGSKMDIHNLATVITPNILHRNNEALKDPRGTGGVDESFLAIEAVHSLIECNESMCEVPEDLALILNDSSLFSNSADITTKEILRRYGDRAKAPTINTNHPPQGVNGHVPSSSHGGGPGSNPVAMRVDRDPNMQNAWSNESSVRHVGPDVGGTTPPTLPYAQPRHSSDSYGSPNRASGRHAMHDKQQQQQQRALGIT